MALPFSILAVTNIYPTQVNPTLGVFVEQQVKGLREIGLDVQVFYVDRRERGVGVYFTMLKPLMDAVHHQKPALLHLMYGGVMADRVTRSNRFCPNVVTLHGSDLLGENFSGRLRKWVSHYGVHCSRRAVRRADGVIVVSRKLKQALPPGVPDSKVRVIPCGIDLGRFKAMDKAFCRQRLGWGAGSFHLLFASNNNDPVKQPWLASAAVEQLRCRGLSTELHYLKGILNTEVPLWLNASDALLLTSAHEGSPTIVKEALACGVPVVAVDVGDVAERIEGILGCELAAAQPEDLSAKLQKVLQSGMRVEAAQKLQQLSLTNVAFSLEKFYRATRSRWERTFGLAGG